MMIETKVVEPFSFMEFTRELPGDALVNLGCMNIFSMQPFSCQSATIFLPHTLT